MWAFNYKSAVLFWLSAWQKVSAWRRRRKKGDCCQMSISQTLFSLQQTFPFIAEMQVYGILTSMQATKQQHHMLIPQELVVASHCSLKWSLRNAGLLIWRKQVFELFWGWTCQMWKAVESFIGDHCFPPVVDHLSWKENAFPLRKSKCTCCQKVWDSLAKNDSLIRFKCKMFALLSHRKLEHWASRQ